MSRWRSRQGGGQGPRGVDLKKLRGPSFIPAPVLIAIPLIVAVFGGLYAMGQLPRLTQEAELDSRQVQLKNHTPSVSVAKVKPASKTLPLILPGDLQPIQKVIVYARTDGYLKSRLVDIGDQVKTGQLLMVIDTPEIQMQLKQAIAQDKQSQAGLKSAQADHVQAQSNLTTQQATVRKIKAQLAYSSAEVKRYTHLAQKGVVSFEQRDQARQNFESDQAAVDSAEAAVKAGDAQVASAQEKVEAAVAALDASKANVDRLKSLEGFQRVVAPCDGSVVTRNVDPGDLIAGGSGNNANELLRIVRTDVMRVFVYVPQTYYRDIHAGQKVEVSVPEMPDKKFEGVVAHVSSALNPSTRTLETEVHVPNKDGQLTVGAYADVKLMIDRTKPPLLLPSAALDVRPDGTYAAVVDADNVVHYKKIKLGIDNGAEVEVESGLKPGQAVVLEPNEDIADGQKVKPELRDLSKKADKK